MLASLTILLAVGERNVGLFNLKSPQERARLLVKMEDGCEKLFGEIVDLLALSLALDGDASLRSAISGGAHRFALRPTGTSGWLDLEGGAPARVCRKAPDGIPHIYFAQLLAQKPEVQRLCVEAGARIAAVPKAIAMLRPIFSVERLPCREDIEALLPWTPILEKTFEIAAVGLANLLKMTRIDLINRAVLNDPERSEDHSLYWFRQMVMSTVTLLATTPGAKWASDMPGFLMTDWTPTWPLFGERSLWGAAIAARAAVAAADVALPIYARRLRDTEAPVVAFDAIFGAAAIAHARPDLREAARAAIKALSLPRYGVAFDKLLADVCIQANALRSEPGAWRRRALRATDWQAAGEGLLTSASLTIDPATTGKTGYWYGLLAIPIGIETAAFAFHPPAASSATNALRAGLNRTGIMALFDRAWVHPTDRPASVH